MRTSPLPGFMKKGCRCTGACRCSSPLKANSQGLKPQALKDKRRRDVEAASTQERIDRRGENHKIGQRSDSDIHHKSDGSTERITVKNNRGFFGRGTKNE
jgi:hypothetical protein